jgi:hypothetical protein
MLSSLKSLFGRLAGSGDSAEAGKAGSKHESVEYNGYRIRPAPYPARGQFQTAGTIEKDFAEGTREHRFVRAETHPSENDAAAFAIAKGRQIIDEQGDRLFDRPSP